MPKAEKKHIVSHSAENMFDLVCDVEAYPEFVPLCESLNVQSRKIKGVKTLLVADMTMAYKMLSETFTTQVMTNREDLTIDVKYIDGPFRYLDNQWRFEALDDDRCEVFFAVDYELRSKMLQLAAGAIFDRAFSKFTAAFEERANEVYGK
jgi:coenzyme Q-binding protein COQ10